VPRLPQPLPVDEVLLNRTECGTMCKVSPKRWKGYADRFPVLLRGRRVVKVNPDGEGRFRWLRSAVLEHLQREMPRDRDPKPGSDTDRGTA